MTVVLILGALVTGSVLFLAGASLGVIGTDRIYAHAARNRIAISRGRRLYHIIDVTATDGPDGRPQKKSAKDRAATRWTFKAPAVPGGPS
jgi:outer membrane murein-binding lipoprotein Lpp